MSESTHGLTYDEISKRLGVPRCRGIRDSGQRCYLDHEAGLIADGYIHWRDRQVRRAGIKHFLLAASVIALPRVAGVPQWVTRYQRLMWVREALLRQFHILLAASAWDEDKAKLRALIARAAIKPEYAKTRREAMLWAMG